MKKTNDDWLENLVENYKTPTTKTAPKKMLTEQQLKIIKDGNT